MTQLNCPFCDPDDTFLERLVFENELARAFWDLNPVSEGHLFVMTKRHVVSFFDMTDDELASVYDLLKQSKTLIDQKHQPDGYNIGVNDGEMAGRTVHHLHIHLIPRYKGDVSSPRGGVRHIIPQKGSY